MGRNIWQSDHPVAMLKALRAIVHEKATVAEAMDVLGSAKGRAPGAASATGLIVLAERSYAGRRSARPRGDCQAWSKAPDSGSGPVGVRGFKSLSPHSPGPTGTLRPLGGRPQT